MQSHIQVNEYQDATRKKLASSSETALIQNNLLNLEKCCSNNSINLMIYKECAVLWTTVCSTVRDGSKVTGHGHPTPVPTSSSTPPPPHIIFEGSKGLGWRGAKEKGNTLALPAIK